MNELLRKYITKAAESEINTHYTEIGDSTKEEIISSTIKYFYVIGTVRRVIDLMILDLEKLCDKEQSIANAQKEIIVWHKCEDGNPEKYGTYELHYQQEQLVAGNNFAFVDFVEPAYWTDFNPRSHEGSDFVDFVEPAYWTGKNWVVRDFEIFEPDAIAWAQLPKGWKDA